MRRSRKVRVARKKKTTVRTLAKMVRNMRPEIKSVHYIFYNNVYLSKTTSGTLSANDYSYLFTYPTQGTADNERVGDHIRVKKIWFKMWICGTNTLLDSFTYRIIIWSPADNKYIPGTNTVPVFWKWSGGAMTSPALQSMVNRTHIKVHYDKQFTYNSIFENGTVANTQKGRFHSINIRPRLQNVTFNTSNDPKYAQNMYYVTVIAGTWQGVDRDIIMSWMGQTLCYYSDN